MRSLKFNLAARLLSVFLLVFSIGCGNNEAPQNSSVQKKNPVSEDSKKPKAKLVASQASAKVKSDKAADKPSKPEPKKRVKPSTPDVNEAQFHDVLSKAIDEYLQYGMVNAVALAAPELCRPAPPSEPAPLMSASEDDESHGQKLYFLFVKDITHYLGEELLAAPVGQTIVKESWSSIESNAGARNLRNHLSGNRINPRATIDGKTMEIGARKNFFVMTKLAKDTPQTDEGWVYGVVDSDTRKVIASGKVGSCMYCHQDAKSDRLFGPSDAIIPKFKLPLGDLPIPKPVSSDDDSSDKDESRDSDKTSKTKK